MKRVFSFLLVLLLVVGLVPVQAMAETAAASAQHNITVIVEGNGTASASPAAASAGENVTINWQPAGTHELKKITGVGPEGSFQIYPYDDEFTMPDGAVTVTVKFGPIGDSEGDEPGGEENGPRSVEAYCYLGAGNPAAPATANPGDTVTITPNPADGYTFQSMRVDYVDVYGEHYDEYTVTSFTMPNADVKVYVTYVKENANGARNIQVSSHSCTVAAPTTAMPGDTVNITVTPEPGHTLPDQYLSVKYMTTNKFVFPDKNGGHNYSFTMPDEDVYISAICVPGEDAPQPPQPAEYTITLDPNTDTAKGTAVFPAKAKAGDTVTITATANDGFYVMAANVSTEQDNPVWDLSKTGEGTYKFTMPAENVKVHILFQAETLYDVTVAPTQNGTATADPTKALMGRPVVITTTPAEGYQVDTITVTADNGQNVPVQDGNKFFMPDSNVTVTVTFETIPTHKITIVKPDNVTLDLPEEVKEGAPITIKPVIPEGYILDEITVTGPDGEKTIQPNETISMPEGDITVTVTILEKITVTFDPADGTVDPAKIDIKKGSTLPSLPQPSRDGHIFTGWYSENGTKITMETVFAENTTVTARWVKASHTTNSAANAYNADINMDDPAVLTLLLEESDFATNEDIIVYMNVESMGEIAVPAADKSAITAKAGADKLAAYLDITLWKKIGNNNPSRISNTSGGVPITMTLDAGVIPADATNVYIVYYHGGAAKDIPASYNPATRTLSFTASEFSTYALAYKPYAAPAATTSAGILDNVPKTGDDAALLNWMLLILCSTAMLAGVAVLDKKRAR